MRVEVAPQTGHPVPQFVIYAENATERAVLQSFISYRQHAKSPVRFWMHGSAYDCGVGVVSFNFGYVYEYMFHKDSRWDRFMRWLGQPW